MSTEQLARLLIAALIGLTLHRLAKMSYRRFLRDFFAAKAMASIMSSELPTTTPELAKGITIGAYIARKSYFMADSMLEARSK